MSKSLHFRLYSPSDRETCLAIFDANCPQFFAANERLAYQEFLDSEPPGYQVCLKEGQVVGAFGLIGTQASWQRLNWIMLLPQAQGSGIGSAIMKRVLELGKMVGLTGIHIAASQYSAPFFNKFGAVSVAETKDGWGPGMDRIDMELHL